MIRLIFLILFLPALHSNAQILLKYYIQGVQLNEQIPTPKSILGYEIGEKHISHDQLVSYLTILANSSERLKIEEYGRTYENRPLLLLTISASENIKNIDQIRDDHVKLADPAQSDQVSINNLPTVIWMGYSVHGNEPSGANSSILLAYYLAAADSDEVKEILKNTVILIDPSINPDGLSRFAQWANQFHSKTLMADPNNIEHNEPWPRGRTNHYWFDLNRDWLLLQHPESIGRIAKFHSWKPNIVTDHHEMGSNSTFFFQPGIPSRNNPNTPEEVIKLTDRMGEYFARGMDEIGSLYYARESFDDFYYGKGSTYPDINGSVGILFEQASSRGHNRETDNGLLTFPFTIRNQFTISLATIKAGYEMREVFLEHKRNFYKEGIELAKNNDTKAYIFDAGKDRGKSAQFIKILNQHQINIYQLNNTINNNNHSYESSTSYVVPLKQAQYRLIKTIFEKQTQFNDSLFYDVSAWTLPLAFDINYAEIPTKQYKESFLGKPVEELPTSKGRIGKQSNYGYLFQWNDYFAPKALNGLMQKNIRVRVAEKSFKIQNDQYDPGTIFIPVKGQDVKPDILYKEMAFIAREIGIDVSSVESGYTTSGINLGSPNFSHIKKPEIMLLVGDGINSYEAGETWHLLDYRFEIPVSLVTINRFNRADIDRYNTIIMVSGRYNGITEDAKVKLKGWLNKGGKIISIQGASKWLANQKLASIAFKNPRTDTTNMRSYEQMSAQIGAQALGGSIFKAQIDRTHPICFGYQDDEISIFKNGKYFFKPSNSPYNNPVLYSSDPLQSGYVSKENLNQIKNSSALAVSAVGEGKIISFSDNPNFRAFWFGTNRMFLNSIFFGDIVSNRSTR